MSLTLHKKLLTTAGLGVISDVGVEIHTQGFHLGGRFARLLTTHVC